MLSCSSFSLSEIKNSKTKLNMYQQKKACYLYMTYFLHKKAQSNLIYAGKKP